MKIVYAVTHVEKEITEDSYEKGEVGKIECVMSEKVNIAADSLPLLFSMLKGGYCVFLEEISVNDLENAEVHGFEYCQLENVNGNRTTPYERGEWKAGRLKLWNARYWFTLEKRQILPITKRDFEDAKIKFA